MLSILETEIICNQDNMKQQIITLLQDRGLLKGVSDDIIEEIEDGIQEIVNSFCSKCNK